MGETQMAMATGRRTRSSSRHRDANRRGAGVLVACCLVLTACGSGPSGDVLTTGAPIEVEVFSPEEDVPDLASLVDHSTFVATGRFAGPPEVLAENEESEAGASVPLSANRVLLYGFQPSEVFRDVLVGSSEAWLGPRADGTIPVVVTGRDVEALRGDMGLDRYLRLHPYPANLNSLLVDEEVLVFLSAEAVIADDVRGGRDDLDRVMRLTSTRSCFVVRDLTRVCAYVAEEPGGREPIASPSPGDGVPAGLQTLADVRVRAESSQRVHLGEDLIGRVAVEPGLRVERSPGSD